MGCDPALKRKGVSAPATTRMNLEKKPDTKGRTRRFFSQEDMALSKSTQKVDGGCGAVGGAGELVVTGGYRFGLGRQKVPGTGAGSGDVNVLDATKLCT